MLYKHMAELHLSGLTGMVVHLHMQKIQIIGFLFDNMLHLAV